MKLPCETALWYTLPQIRADLARELIKQGLSQKEVAEKLGITPSAVSQYLHRKRGGKIKMSKDYKSRVEETAKNIKKASSESDVSKLICKCCMETRPSGLE
jgi:predicted transcriptional regulator